AGAASNPDTPNVFDSAKVGEFLRGKGMDEESIKTVCDMFPSNMAGDEDDDDKDDDKDKDKGKGPFGMDSSKFVSKQAFDEALKGQGESFEKRIADVRKNEQGIRVALDAVRAYVGEIPPTMAFDSAADVYRHALVMKGVDGAKTMHPDALPTVLKTLPKIGAKPVEVAHIAMDSNSDAFKAAREIAPGLANISAV